MAQNSSESTNNSTIESAVGSQSLENTPAVVAKALSNVEQVGPAMKQSSNLTSDALSSQSVPTPPEKQNGSTNARSEVVDLTIPVKTKGEPSSMTLAPMADTSTSGSLTLGQRDGLASTPTATEGMGMTAFGNQMAGLGAQLQLTAEEQAAAYKKANVLALTALAKKGGPNAKEMLAVQQKLQEFLTSLIALAGQKGPDLKVKVQQLVQHLVTGQISEEDFASRIEADLHSQHQPSLLPFLKNSVPHLKTRLQLQQAIMRELLQRQAADKQQQKNSAPSKQLPLTPAPPPVKNPLPASTNLTSSVSPSPLSLPFSAQGKPAVTKSSDVTPAQSSAPSVQATALPLQKQAKSTNANDPIIIPATSNTSAAIVVGPLGGGQIPAALQQQLASAFNSPAFQQQFFNQLPKNIRDQVAKLPLEQQKFVYAHHLRRMQHMKMQAQQNGSSTTGAGDGKQASSAVASSFPSGSATTSSVVASPQLVLQKQQQLVKQQQGAFVIGGVGGGAKTTSFSVGGKSGTGSVTATTTAGAATVGGSAGGKSVQVLNSGGKTSFVNMKVSAPSAGGQQASSSSPSKKERSKGAKHKDGTTGDDEEDEVVGMEILDEVGVNLQEETAHFLPRSVGERTQRLYKDEVFLNGPQLKQRVLPIVRRYGLSDVSDDFLVLLSHATQERLKGVVEKLTQISQHRISVLKDSDKYAVSSETRSQLRVLETIDRVVSKRKQERENEQTLKAAKSRSKGTDPEKVAKLREEAKQIQQDKANQLLNAAANQTALAAIGQRKRPLADGGGASGSSQAGSSSDGSSSTASLFAPLTTTRAPKRHITSRDLIFYMEQERETRKSLTLYRTLLK